MNISTGPARQLLQASAAAGGECPQDLRGVVVVGVEGDIDLYTGPELRRTFAEVLCAPVGGPEGAGSATTPRSVTGAGGSSLPVRAVIVDLTEVEFMDSFAVGVLVQGHHLARRSGAGYAVVATHPMIHSLFAVTGLAKVMPLHPDVASAVAGLGSAA